MSDAVVIAGVIADGKPPGRVAFLLGIAGFSGALVRNGGVRLRIQPAIDLLRHSDGRFTSNFGRLRKHQSFVGKKRSLTLTYRDRDDFF